MQKPLMIFILLIFTSTSALARKKACSKITKKAPVSYCYYESEIVGGNFKIPSSTKVVTEYQWLNLSEMPDRLVDLFELDLSRDKESKILYSHASYLIDADFEKFSPAYFANEQVMNTLSGMQNTKTDNPYVYKVRFTPNIPLAPTLSSTTTLSFPNDFTKYHELKTIDNSSFVVLTKSRDFNKEVYQSDIITAITKEGDKVRIETLAIGHITDTSFGIFSVKSKIKASQMLKAIKTQTPIGRTLYLSK